MQKKKIDTWNYLLMHLRHLSKLTIREICRQTGIPERIYNEMEAGRHVITSEEADLLGTLLGIEPYYLSQQSYQVELIRLTKYVLEYKQEKINQLSRALKRKINTTKKDSKKYHEKDRHHKKEVATHRKA